ncbi:MAG: UDP-N-acetylglucosamine 2-epimerase (hydrolyzing) [Acidimicrobiaceae bacterium]|nr:UDP-N-acetylglucosamine 2-epimerase (hydrolyzing) [Acidimicrobiaceae bacterium]
MGKRKIAVFTGNRAEYGLQFPILKAISNHPDLEYQLIVSGAHLDKDFGQTLDEIKNDGFKIAAEVKIQMDSDFALATPQAIGSGIVNISQALANLKPDMMIVYADRFEGFAAVVASTQMSIPTAHIEGGDITEGGALDDSVRHAMTKLSHLHFTTNDEATRRIIAMGEESWRVHTVGFPAIDLISDGRFAKPIEISKQLGLDLSQPIVLFTQHSVTTEAGDATSQIRSCLDALLRLANDGVQVIATYPNNDAGGRAIVAELEKVASLKPKNFQLHKSLGRYLYHGILALSRNPDHRIACLGNSSSGIKETPIFGTPTVNIGSRQLGRLRGSNVKDANYSGTEIYEFAHICLFDDIWRAECAKTDNPYWKGGAGSRIANVLSTVELNQSLLRKRMTIDGSGAVRPVLE